MNSAPPPPVGGGNTKYLLVLLFLGLGIGGLVYSRMTPSGPTTAPIASIAPSALPTISHREEDDFIPPPPPLPEAGPDTGAKVVTSLGPASTGCEPKTCGGTSTPDLEGALMFNAKRAHKCYDRALESDSTLKGALTLSVRVSPSGQVCSANVVSNTMGSQSIVPCVTNVFQRASGLPAPKGGCVDANVPINFTPGGK